MSSPVSNPLLTEQDLYAIPEDGFKYELQAGLLVSEPLPGFRQGRVAARLASLLDAHVRAHRLGAVLSNDSGFVLAQEPDTVRGPDVAFVSAARIVTVGDATRAFHGAPDLAIEVLSPSNTPSAIHAKVADYLAAGTRLVWLADSERQTITAYRSLLSPRIFRSGELLDGEDVLPGFRVDVSEVFEP